MPPSEEATVPVMHALCEIANGLTPRLKTDGTIRCWGDGEYGQIGKGFATHGPGTTLPFKSLDKSDPTGHLTNVRGGRAGRYFTAVFEKRRDRVQLEARPAERAGL